MQVLHNDRVGAVDDTVHIAEVPLLTGRAPAEGAVYEGELDGAAAGRGGLPADQHGGGAAVVEVRQLDHLQPAQPAPRPRPRHQQQLQHGRGDHGETLTTINWHQWRCDHRQQEVSQPSS